MKKAIFFDIDGTLWDEEQRIPDSTREALRLLKENGHYLFLCSGRTRIFIPDGDLMPLGFDGIVAGCGTYGEFQGETKFYHRIGLEQITRDCAFLDEMKASYILEGRYALYMDQDRFEEEFSYYNQMQKVLGDKLLSVTGNQDKLEVSKFCINYLNSQEDQRKVEQELEKNYGLIQRVGNFMEVVPKGFNKATGIQEMCKILSVRHEDTYAFGDSTNDLDMLRYTAHSVAMGDGMQEAKDAAEYVTTALWEDGIYNGAKHYGLI